jgi:hypothetical protein
MTEIRGSERSKLDEGEVSDRRSDMPMDMVIQMVTAATCIATETAGVIISAPVERSENGKRRRRSDAWAAPSDWRSRMKRTIRQQVHELTQLH